MRTQKPASRTGITSPLTRLQKQRVKLVAVRGLHKDTSVKQAIQFREARLNRDIRRLKIAE